MALSRGQRNPRWFIRFLFLAGRGSEIEVLHISHWLSQPIFLLHNGPFPRPLWVRTVQRIRSCQMCSPRFPTAVNLRCDVNNYCRCRTTVESECVICLQRQSKAKALIMPQSEGSLKGLVFHLREQTKQKEKHCLSLEWGQACRRRWRSRLNSDEQQNNSYADRLRKKSTCPKLSTYWMSETSNMAIISALSSKSLWKKQNLFIFSSLFKENLATMEYF